MLNVNNYKKVEYLFNNKRFFTLLKNERLDRLKREVRYKPNDNFLILQFYKEANVHNPNEVIKHYENTNFLKNESVTKEYIKALVYTNKLKYTNLDNIKYNNDNKLNRRNIEEENMNQISNERSNIYEANNLNTESPYTNLSQSTHKMDYLEKKKKLIK